MIGEPRKTGLLGEMYAANYLRDKGYDIYAANYRTKVGEIDLIARNEHMLVCVEVKTRKKGGYFAPSVAVDAKKEENVRSAAASYIAITKITDPIRYDIIEVVLDGDEYGIRHLENAF